MAADLEPVPDFFFFGVSAAETDGLIFKGLEGGVFKAIVLKDFKALDLESPVVEEVGVVLTVRFEETRFFRVEERYVNVTFIVECVAIHHSNPDRRPVGKVGAGLSKVGVDVFLGPTSEGRDGAPCHAGGGGEGAKHAFGRAGHFPSRPRWAPGITGSEGHTEVGCHSGGRFPGVVVDFGGGGEAVENIFAGTEPVAVEGWSGAGGIWIGWVAAKMTGSV